MRVSFGNEGSIGPLQKLLVLIAVQVERTGNGDIGSNDLPNAPCYLGFRSGNASYGHGAVKRKIHTVNGHIGFEVISDDRHEMLEAFSTFPASRGATVNSIGRVDPDYLNIRVFACGMHKAANKSSFTVNEFVALYEGNAPRSVLNLSVSPGTECARFLHVCDHRELVRLSARRGWSVSEKREQ